MGALAGHLKAAVPNGVKVALAHALRRVGAPRRIQSFLAFDGTFTLPAGEELLALEYANRWIERDLFWNGWSGYEPVSTDIWKRCVPGARTIVDIGANSGLFALTAKVMNPAALVVAFEPLPLFANALERNARLNGADILLARAAVSNANTRAQFFVPHELAGNIYSSSLSQAHYELHQKSQPQVLDVEVVRFDTFAAEHRISSVDLVKVDAEGHDALVIAGMAETIARDTPDFLVEIQDDATGEAMMPCFDPHLYAYFNLSETEGARRTDRISRSATVNFLVCKHETAARLFG